MTSEMLDGLKLIRVEWVDAPLPGYRRVNDGQYHHVGKLESCVWWRGRWCLVSDMFLDAMGEIDQRMRDGRLGLEWVRW